MKIIKKREDDHCLLSKCRSTNKRVTYPKHSDELLAEAVTEVLAAYGGDIDGRQQDFEKDVMIASSMKGLGWDGKKRKKKRRWR